MISTLSDHTPTAISDPSHAALWRAMFESSGLMAGVFELLDDDYRYVLVNPTAAAFYGLQPADLVGRTGRELRVSEAHRKRRLDTLRRCWSSFETITREYPFDHDGRSGWFLGTFSPIAGERPRVSFVLVDISERKQAQLLAERQQTRLDLALRAAGLGLWEYDLRAGAASWDVRTRELLGAGADAPTDYAAYIAGLEEEDAAAVQTEIRAALGGANGGHYTILHRAKGPNGQQRWLRGSGQVLFDAEGRPTDVLGTVQDVTEEVETREKQALLVAELNHRVKNNLATVQSMAAQTARRATSLDQFIHDFEGRLVSLARTHDVLTQNSWSGAETSTLLECELAAYGDRVRLEGPRVELSASAALSLALIAHELATNAAKYGALSVAGGQVDVTWASDAGLLRLTWRERGGPPCRPPSEAGFGTRLIQRLARGELGGEAETVYAPDGLVFRLRAPLRPSPRYERL